MALTETFRTDRLLAERLREEHLGEIRRMHHDPRVMATLGGLRSDEQTARYLRDNTSTTGTGTGTGSGRSRIELTAGSWAAPAATTR